MDCLNLEEPDLVRALIRWGKHQVQMDGDDSTDGQKLRSKILPALQFIRFAALSHNDFAHLCLKELGTVLHLEEKYSILMALATGEWNLVPTEVVTPESITIPRKMPFTVFQLEFSQLDSFYNSSFPSRLSSNLLFKLDKNADFVGLKVNSSQPGYKAISCELFAAGVVIGKCCTSRDKFDFEGEEFLQITPKCTLEAGTQYNLTFNLSCISLNDVSTFGIPLEKRSITVHGLTLKIDSPHVKVHLEKMLFT
jgi:hypothetical protein